MLVANSIRSSAIRRNHTRRTHYRSDFVQPAAICGRVGCENPALIWLTPDEIKKHKAGQRVFGVKTHTVRVRVGDELISSEERAAKMAHYIALIHKDRDSCYGVSFPDVPGVFTAGDTIDEAMRNAVEVLAFAAENWSDLSGEHFPTARTIDELRADANFQERAGDAVVAAVPFRADVEVVA